MLTLLLLWNVLMPAWIVWHTCLTRQGLEVNHLLTFSFGFVLYGLLPIAVGLASLDVPFPGANDFYKVFADVPPKTLYGYLACCTSGYLAFVGGSAVSWYLVRPPKGGRSLVFDRRLLYGGLIATLVGVIVLVVRLRDQLFTGYATLEGFGGGLRGSLVASSLVLLSLALLEGASRQYRLGLAFRLRHLVRTPFFAVYTLVMLLVLSLGSRLYLVSSVLIVMSYLSCYVHRVRGRHIGGLLLGTGLVAALVGLWRVVGASMAAAAYGLLAEPLLVSLSLLDFLAAGTWPLLQWPWLLLYDGINLLPTLLFPDKERWLLSPEAVGYTLYSPYGAMHMAVSALINFGVMGTLVWLFMLGFGMQSLRTRSAGPLSRTIYAMLTGWLAFTFFRDPFFVSLVKSMFQYSILVPVVMVLALHVMTQAVWGGPQVRWHFAREA
jgi:hypothetical protein